MEAAAIHGRLKEQPFRPFRIILSSGDKLEVRHPEMAVVLKTRIFVSLPNGNDFPDKSATVSLLHVVDVEDAEPVGFQNS